MLTPEPSRCWWVQADGGNARPQGWDHLGSIPNIAGEGDIESVDGGAQCTLHPALRSLHVYDRFLLTTEAVANWRSWKKKTVRGKTDDGLMAAAPMTAAQLQQKVDTAIAQGSPSVDVPGGAYLFNASGGRDFLVLGAKNLRIRALAPVTLYFAGSAGVNITDSTDVQLVGSGGGAGWILDYDPPPAKQQLAGSTLNLLNCTRVLAEDVTIRAAPYMAV